MHLVLAGLGTKEMGSGVSLGVFEYACEAIRLGQDWPGFVNPQFVYLTKRPSGGCLVLGDTDLSVSRELEIEDWTMGDVELGELCAERYRLPD